ncbi:hypothetical protein B9Z19DRAFT_1135014 [Tuber borchii]|uniref:Uncharacterized protein n=1 Tax=Tuber borchii TaxID=42251 RepID=A0A2T6ZDH1_TUBBO|nr:hypothetical protein B9Z19DRAFT_1135014 [Tuber borchii]
MANNPPTPSTSLINQKPPPPFPRLPPHKKFHKRPLLHPPIPPRSASSSSSSGPKTIYISPRTPFVSAIKRARTLLGSAPGEVILLRASGRAIEKALQVGLCLLEGGEGVRICTGGVEVLDDVVGVGGYKRKWGEEEEGDEGEGEEEGEEEKEEEGEDVRRRWTSTVEVWVTKK